MNKYINTFASSGDYETYKASSAFTTPNVAYIEGTDEVIYMDEEPTPAHDYSQDYLTFDVLSDGIIEFTSSNQDVTSLQYSTDSGNTWTNYSTGITVTTGDNVMLKAEYTIANNASGQFKFVGTTCRFNAMGNPLSLCFSDFGSITTIPKYSFSFMFSGCTGLVSAENLSLPATTLNYWSYIGMFKGCTSLTTAPALPATTLGQECYSSMFSGCTSLTTAPALPATTLAQYCYDSMFAGCTSLTTAPELPATTLDVACYFNMFKGCTSLTTAPALPATTLADNCYDSMFAGCTSLTTAPATLPATTLGQECYSSMFSGCTSLTTAPELPAANLDASQCYKWMFRYCSSLNYIKMLATYVRSGSMAGWLTGVSSTGTFVKHPSMTTLPTGTSGIPTGWTVIDA